jgi:hypothetical protein
MRSIWRIPKLLNPPLLHRQGAFGMINIFVRNAHHHLQIFKIYNPIAASLIGCGRAATPHRKPKVVPHIFQLLSLITQPPTHEIPSAPEPLSANLSPSTACANSVVGRSGRTFHLTHLESYIQRVWQSPCMHACESCTTHAGQEITPAGQIGAAEMARDDMGTSGVKIQ